MAVDPADAELDLFTEPPGRRTHCTGNLHDELSDRCAADATTTQVQIRGPDAPETDTWVTVTGTWRPRGELGSPSAWPPVWAATTVVPVAEPSNPYEER
ncbi:hypothetical protein ACFUAC_06565 [Streptomyces sp. NPDC057148]|uniref:hypothetical protein n=1 Tax=unclassified Streptomyces TaxID=2593676 RepID=UPI00363AE0DA